MQSAVDEYILVLINNENSVSIDKDGTLHFNIQYCHVNTCLYNIRSPCQFEIW